ncbi:MAG: calcineurin-like phosphoesterase family protein, partial [Proteobacteria bacterium]|nr:calcineurin-like phosphoesterase family protein [Pseudomonadota bacterium]
MASTPPFTNPEQPEGSGQHTPPKFLTAAPPPAKSRSASKAKAEQARIAAKLVAASNTDVPCTECADKAELQAVILFPALGTPCIAHSSEKTIKLYLLVEDKCLEFFDIKDKTHAPLAWYFINRHLRLTPFKDTSKTSATIKGEGLYSSEAFAKQAIKVWYHGTYASGIQKPGSGHWGDLIYDHEGQAFATLRTSSIDFFVKAKAAYGPITPPHDLDARQADVSNQPLRHLIEVELSTDGLKDSPQKNAGTAYSLAWMVTCVYQKAVLSNGKLALPEVSHWEHQDKLIYDFLAMMQRNKQHFAEPFVFDIGSAETNIWPEPLRGEANRLKSFHPVMFKDTETLTIGHLSDVHVSSRHFALAQSPAQIIPGASEQFAKKLANSFIALKELFGSMRDDQHKADVIFITGDLIDFNHNLHPREIKGDAPKDHWATYNLNTYFEGGKLNQNAQKQPIAYPRSLDDMLVYSLIKDSYTKNCPVFMVTGNHEAYDVPYGVSPRLNYATTMAGPDEALAISKKKRRRERIEKEATALDAKGKHEEAAALRATLPESERDARTDAVTPPGMQSGAGANFWGDLASAKSGVSPDKRPDAYAKDKANEGIAADHNLTIYEACLAYGPTAGKVLRSWNFIPANFDWFFMLFTPLADFQVSYGAKQCLIGLDWGESEIMVNLPGVGEGNSVGGVLPLANQSLNETQCALLRDALATSKKAGRKNVLFSHFTMINYDQPIPHAPEQHWYKRDPHFSLAGDGYSDYNVGTFSQNRQWLFAHFNGQSSEGNIHFTMGGHSHRAGAYALEFNHDYTPAQLKPHGFEPCPLAIDHKLAHSNIFKTPELTRILVSSCGGPIGVQNHQGELEGWNLKPPSGTLLKTHAQGAEEFVRVTAKGRKPRFCVALDYLVVMKDKPVITWERTTTPGDYIMTVSEVLGAEKDFVESVTFYVWDSKKEALLPIKHRDTDKKIMPGKDPQRLHFS